MRATLPRRATATVGQPSWVSDWWLPESDVAVAEQVAVVGHREAVLVAPAAEEAPELAVSGREVAVRATREVCVRRN